MRRRNEMSQVRLHQTPLPILPNRGHSIQWRQARLAATNRENHENPLFMLPEVSERA